MKGTLGIDTLRIIARRFLPHREVRLSDIVAGYDVVIMKHCFPSSDILEDIGKSDPASTRQSLENYKAVYRLLQNSFNENPDTLFILWTLPPRHRLYEPSEGSREGNAARASEFSWWLNENFNGNNRVSNNTCVWDFRGMIIDPDTNFLRYDYERSHDIPDSHPNQVANKQIGPLFAQFIVDSITLFTTRGKGIESDRSTKIIFLCHSTGWAVFDYDFHGIKGWYKEYNAATGSRYYIKNYWYPLNGNMPIHYYQSWLS